MERGLPDVHAGFRKDQGTRDIIADTCWIIEKAKNIIKNSVCTFLTIERPCVNTNLKL